MPTIKIMSIQFSRKELAHKKTKTPKRKYLFLQTNQKQNLKPEEEAENLESLPSKSRLWIIQMETF